MFKGFQKFMVLKELSRNDVTGYSLIKRLEDISGKRPSPGYIYPLLNELFNERYVSKKEEGNKIIYKINEKGRTLLNELSNKKNQLDRILFSLETKKSSETDILQKFRTGFEKHHDVMLMDIDIILKLQKASFNIYDLESPSKRKKMREIILRTIKEMRALARE